MGGLPPEKPHRRFDELLPHQKEIMLMIVRGCLEKLQEVGLLDPKVAGSIEQQEASIISLIDEGIVKPELFQMSEKEFQARLTVWNGHQYIPIGKFQEENPH